ncbi:MAG TPA: hypothetical protein VJ843_00530 [Candidatus Saccharimonadales bacterium]|nr:hypothetical protein [Candidatus Saccharimonadales bacterium]
MAELLKKLLETASNPVIVIIILLFALTITVLWRLFEKQHDFIRERVELLFQKQHDFIRERLEILKTENEHLQRQVKSFREDNEKLHLQMQVFREENNQLRKASSAIVRAVEDLQKQPLLYQQHIDEINTLTREVAESLQRNASIQLEAFYSLREDLKRAVRERASEEDIVSIIQELVSIVGYSQRESSERIIDLGTKVRKLLER